MMSEAGLQCIEVDTGPAPRLSIVWLHGLGADGHDFAPIVPELRLPFAARFVFPHAPVRPITINGGMPMRAWFDIVTLQRGGAEDAAAIEISASAVAQLLDAECARGFEPQNIVLAGFSQGGALALHLGLRYPRRLAGIAALSGFVPLADRLAREANPAYRDLPIFMAHGTQDNVIEPPFAELGRDQLIRAGFTPSWHSYAMGHAVCAQEIQDVSQWLQGLAKTVS
jgi:phospholipase/carboxylesterase